MRQNVSKGIALTTTHHEDSPLHSKLKSDEKCASNPTVGQKIEKGPGKKHVKSNKKNREIVFLAILNFFLVQKLISRVFFSLD